MEGALVNDKAEFLNGFLSAVFMIIPASLTLSGVILVGTGHYDFWMKNIQTERTLLLESDVFEEEVSKRVSELRAEDIYEGRAGIRTATTRSAQN